MGPAGPTGAAAAGLPPVATARPPPQVPGFFFTGGLKFAGLCCCARNGPAARRARFALLCIARAHRHR